MTPDERKDYNSLLGQIRGLTAKVERLESELSKRPKHLSTTESLRCFESGRDDAIDDMFAVLREHFKRGA